MDNLQHSFDDLMTLEQFSIILENKRIDYKHNWVRTKPAGRPPSTTPSFIAIRLSDGAEFKFKNFNSTRPWLRKETGKHVDNDTIWRRMKSGVPLNGILYKPVH
jgi:hypothetical protein